MTEHDPLADDRRPDVFDLWKHYHFHTDVISQAANVPEKTLIAMLYHNPVPRRDAEKVIHALALYTGQPLTLDNVRARTITGPLEELPDTRPTLTDLWRHYEIKMASLHGIGIPYPVLLDMIRNNPVRRSYAEKVLMVLSRQLHRNFTLETVNMRLLPDETRKESNP